MQTQSFLNLRSALLLAVGVVGLAGHVNQGHADPGAAFLEIPVGAAPAALGSAYTALATDAYAPIWNPAGLGFLESSQVAAQHLAYLESMNYEYLSFVHPFRTGDSLGISAQYLTSGDIAGTDELGSSTGDYSDTFGAYTLAYGHAFNDKFSLGLAGKLIHIKLQDVSANAYAADLGGLYKVNPKLQLAAVLANIGTKIKFINEGDSLPSAFRIAAAYQPVSRLMLTTEAILAGASDRSVRVGAEWRPLDLIALRAGYRTDTLKELSALAGFSTGIGIQLWEQELAYAWVPYGDLGNTQYISLLLRFGATERSQRNLIQYQNIKSHQSVKDPKNDTSDPETQQLMQLLNEGDKKEQLGQSNKSPDSHAR